MQKKSYTIYLMYYLFIFNKTSPLFKYALVKSERNVITSLYSCNNKEQVKINIEHIILF